jgi:hypothetical protein
LGSHISHTALPEVGIRGEKGPELTAWNGTSDSVGCLPPAAARPGAHSTQSVEFTPATAVPGTQGPHSVLAVPEAKRPGVQPSCVAQPCIKALCRKQPKGHCFTYAAGAAAFALGVARAARLAVIGLPWRIAVLAGETGLAGCLAGRRERSRVAGMTTK